MAVLIEAHFEGMTVEDYLEMARQINVGGPPPGAISHRAVETDYGIKVVDEWESEDAFNAFFDKIAPIIEDMDYEADIEAFPIIKER